MAVAVAGVAAIPLVERPRRRRGRGSRRGGPATASSGPPSGIVCDERRRSRRRRPGRRRRGSWRRRASCRRGRRPARSAGRPSATRRNRPSSLSSSAAIRSREPSGRQGSRLRSVRKIMTSCVPPQLTARQPAVAADGHAVGVGRGLAPRVERERGERLRAVERDPRQPLAEDPAQVDVVARSWRTRGSSCWRRSPSGRRGRSRPAGGCRPSIGMRPLDRPRPGRDRPRRLCDRALPTSRRAPSGESATPRGSRPTASRPVTLLRVEVDADDLVAHADGDVGRRAVGRDHHPARLGADLDPAGDLEPVGPDVEDRPGRSRTSA